MKSFIKKFITKNPFKSFSDILEYIRWTNSGRPTPPPHLAKVRFMRARGRDFRIRTFIETGTYLGDTIEAVRRHFAHTYSIEVDENLYQKAKQRFARDPHVRIYKGDSAQLLSQLVSKLEEPALFWLDGHYSGGITGMGSKETPIMEELGTIARSPIKQHVILIDDARLFDGTKDYPTIPEVTEFARIHFPKHVFIVKDDIISISPLENINSTT